MLDESGIKWQLSSCRRAIPADSSTPQDSHTLIATASAANRTSFGCGSESEATLLAMRKFARAALRRFVRHGVWQARERIAERERAEGVSPPSDPQIYVGEAMAAKLPQLRRGALGAPAIPSEDIGRIPMNACTGPGTCSSERPAWNLPV
jgi:hypothetical protein